MIVDYLKAAAFILLALAAIPLPLIALLAPTQVIPFDGVALLTVTSKGVDGPSVFMGLLRSCSKINNAAAAAHPVNCTNISTNSPVYNFTTLPDSAANLVLSAPAVPTPVFIIAAISCSIIFFIAFTLIFFFHKPEKGGTVLRNPMVQRLSAWVGFIGFLIGITSFLAIWIWFSKAVQDFNAVIATQGKGGPQAQLGPGFILAWVAYASYAVVLFASYVKLKMTKSILSPTSFHQWNAVEWKSQIWQAPLPKSYFP